MAITVNPSRKRRYSGQAALIPAAVTAGRTSPKRRQLLAEESALQHADAIASFVDRLGGRERLAEALAIAETAPECEALVQHLLDPRFRLWSLPKVCALAGFTVADLFQAYRKATLLRAHIEATHRIAAKLAPIVEDVMARALPRMETCLLCKGKKTRLRVAADGTRTQIRCPQCRGVGERRVEPSADHQKLALELGQLTAQKGGGTGVIVNQQNITAGAAAAQANAASAGPLEQLQQAVGQLLFSPDRQRASATVDAGSVVEAQTVEPPTTTIGDPPPPEPTDPPEERERDEPDDEPDDPVGPPRGDH